MEEARDYQVNLEVFQGPLDLLLFLIRKKKIDIHDIPIATVTREYLSYLHQKEKINLEREGEFLLIAALLIYVTIPIRSAADPPVDWSNPETWDNFLTHVLARKEHTKVIMKLTGGQTTARALGLLSLTWHDQRCFILEGRITAAATTGPARAPRPTSSIPAIYR